MKDCPFLVNCLRATVWCWKSGMKKPTDCRVLRTSEHQFDPLGQEIWEEQNLDLGLEKPLYQKWHIQQTMWNFDNERVTCSFLHLCKIEWSRVSNSDGVVAHTNMSSTILRHHGRPSITQSESHLTIMPEAMCFAISDAAASWNRKGIGLGAETRYGVALSFK